MPDKLTSKTSCPPRAMRKKIVAAGLILTAFLGCAPNAVELDKASNQSPDKSEPVTWDARYALAYAMTPDEWQKALRQISDHGGPVRENFEALLLAYQRDNNPVYPADEYVLAAARVWGERNKGKLEFLCKDDVSAYSDRRRILAKVCLGKLPAYEVQREPGDGLVGWDRVPIFLRGPYVPGADWSGVFLPRPDWYLDYEDVMAVLSTAVVIPRKDEAMPLEACRAIEKATGRPVIWYPERSGLDIRSRLWAKWQANLLKREKVSVGDLLSDLRAWAFNLHQFERATAQVLGAGEKKVQPEFDYRAIITKHAILMIGIPNAKVVGDRK